MVEANSAMDVSLAAGCNGPTSTPILHLHLLQRCNLSCVHCYSYSGPTARMALSRQEALGAVDLAYSLGYAHVAISGGEPLLSPHLGDVLRHARALGLETSVVTNGIQSASPSNLKLLALTDSVCVSLDGVGDTHDNMRGRAGAFDSAVRSLAEMGLEGLRCGVSCGISWQSLNEMEEVTEVVLNAGARFLNFHAVEAAGRAATMVESRILSWHEHALLYVASHLLAQATAGQLDVHCDLVHKHRVANSPGLLYLQAPAQAIPSQWSALALGVLVVEPNGRLAPVCYGFDPRLDLGTLQQAMASSGASVMHGLPDVLSQLEAAGVALSRELECDEDWTVFNPSAELSRVAQLN